MISFYILSESVILKCKGLSDARVASITRKKTWFCSTFFIKSLKSISDE